MELGDEVHDLASPRRASAINNEGLESQVAFLVRQVGAAGAERMIRAAAGRPGREPEGYEHYTAADAEKDATGYDPGLGLDRTGRAARTHFRFPAGGSRARKVREENQDFASQRCLTAGEGARCSGDGRVHGKGGPPPVSGWRGRAATRHYGGCSRDE